MKKITTLSIFTLALASQAAIDMGTPFTDGVVLQRERNVPVWGRAEPGKKITVEFAGNSVSVKADEKGAWRVNLPPMEASKENRVMKITESECGWLWDDVTDSVEIKDVLVGEVWFCAGQSNTECPIWGGNPRYRDGWGPMMLLSSNRPWVRFVKTRKQPSEKPLYNYKAKWMSMTPEMYDLFMKRKPLPSAMGYYFVWELSNALNDIPFALIDSSWGGTNIDTWTPPSGHKSVPALKDMLAIPTMNKADFDKARKAGKFKNVYGRNGWQQQSAALWNGMVAAYTPMACRGFIWYQGCSNSGEFQRYRDKMHALYNGWAKEFENPDMKLYFVQLAPFSQNWMGICEAQNRFASEQKNAAISVVADAGNFWDIHPSNKRVVGKRLSLHALKYDYGFDRIKSESPIYKSVKFNGNKAEISFDNVESWYVYADDRSVTPPFEVAGADGKWVKAKLLNVDKSGIIKGKTLVVTADGVDKPVKVRYMGINRTSGTLFNEAALPLGPFTSK